MFGGFLFQLIVFAVLVVIILVLWRRSAWARAQRQRLNDVKARCQDPRNQATIFVLVVTHGNAHAAAHTLHSLFERAACPFRVFVGLHETAQVPAAVYDDPVVMRTLATQATPVMSVYTRLARHGAVGGRSFADQIHVMRAPYTRSFGTHAARAALMAQAYRGQTYVMTLSDAAQVVDMWDEVAVEQLERAEAAQPQQQPVVLVAPPAEPSLATTTAVRDAWDVAATSFLRPPASSAPDGSADGTSGAARFPVFTRFSKAGLPVVGSRVFGRPPSSASAPPLPVLFWCGDCSFARAGAYTQAAPFDPNLVCLTSGEDALMSARLYTHGWRFCSPCVPLATYQHASLVHATEDAHRTAILHDKAKSAAARVTHEAARHVLGARLKVPHTLHIYTLGPLASLEDWMYFAGVNVAEQVGTGRARMGATPTATVDEIVAKYDSITAFQAERSVYP